MKRAQEARDLARDTRLDAHEASESCIEIAFLQADMQELRADLIEGLEAIRRAILAPREE